MRSILKGAVLAATAAAMVSAMALPASADPAQAVAANDITMAGSDTIEFYGNDLATAYNGQAVTPANLLDSWNAINPTTGGVHDQITIKPGVTVTRPDGSSEGIAALQAPGSQFDVARSSRGPKTGETGLGFIPVAEDTVRYALSGTTPSNGVDGLTAAQLASIYQCTTTDWSQVGGTAGAIQPMIPQTGSGTRSFFLSSIGLTDAQLGTCVTTVQEHDYTPIQNNSGAVAPFSVARYNTKVPAGAIALNTTGFVAYRPVYLVVRDAGAHTVPAYLQPLVGDGTGPNGFVCSNPGQQVVTSDGFTALPDQTNPPAFCGVATWV